MNIALCGLVCSGKSTIFRALAGKETYTKTATSGKLQLTIGTLEVKDRRLENLGGLLHSEKISYLKIDLVDLNRPSEKLPQKVDTIHTREFLALGIVVGVFSSEDPVGDLRNVESELLLADLQVVQNRIERLKKAGPARPQREEGPELPLLERLVATLEEGKAIKDLRLSGDELKMLSGFQLLTLKPAIIIGNISEAQLAQSQPIELEQQAKARNKPLFVICAKLEAEIAELPEGEQEQFCKEMGLVGLSRDKFIQLCFQALERSVFFTVVGKEARAWPIPKGTTALSAAGCVHSDMEKGFIRAEVINYKDFIGCGTFSQAKEKGLLHLESKDYLVQDGDIINFKFNL